MGESIMMYEFEVIGNITSIVKKKEVKKDVIFKKLFELDEVTSIEEFTNEKGIVVSKQCLIVDKQSMSYRVNYPYNKAKELLMPISVIGFIGKTKGYEKSNNKNKDF